MKKVFFGYLTTKNKIITRIISFIFIISSPIFYYKTTDGLFVEDVLAMYFYGSSLEVFYFWGSSFIIIVLISVLLSKNKQYEN
jgi:hypothetical protein|tara:strand:- start:5832 stop:6080 length:249 start_codon:yes stop_codon:yes gene_type:complete